METKDKKLTNRKSYYSKQGSRTNGVTIVKMTKERPKGKILKEKKQNNQGR